MTELEAVKCRHSVRSYFDKPIEDEKVKLLNCMIKEINEKTSLHIQLLVNEPKCFDVNDVDYGIFKNCKNYFTMVGPKGMDEEIGYYGQKLVIYAQQLGLNTCWVKTSFKKSGVTFEHYSGEKLYIVIALGYGETQGHERKTKPMEALSNVSESSPEWFKKGVEAAMLAPTALNQQRFYLSEKDGVVKAKAKFSILTHIDLGIVKYNFEIGAGKENFKWAE
ncbi:MAG: nitroreductase family protein [Oscillospiraceae bacterium]|nr:nitroreductase family protein [Oscillospiraceae bacterium]